jgi:tRNA-specific 2-thiouridylase
MLPVRSEKRSAPRLAPGARVVVAMSGGVDSSVAAALLKEQGYDVIGISLQLHDLAKDEENKFGTCCSLDDLYDARKVATRLGIPFYVKEMESAFEEAVIDDFVAEYLAGRTPNPCVRCNEKVKFRRLLDWALDLGAEALATGHYARITDGPNGPELRKAVDPGKDQSYFLFTLKPDELAHTVFPVGHLTKPEVRAIAARHGLDTASKPDSQEICFVRGKSYRDFIEERVPKHERVGGPIVLEDGTEIGRHEGLYQFTIGQRKGLPAIGKPIFVLALDRARNAVVVGPEKSLFQDRLTLADMHWLVPEPTESQPGLFTAKIRYRHAETAVRVVALPNHRAELRFSLPQRAVTPGQAVVLYDGDRVVGGGWIEAAIGSDR